MDEFPLQSRSAAVGLKIVYGIAVVFVVALIFVICSTVSCTNETKARSTLEANGYKSIKFTGYDIMACSSDDTTCTGFEATAPSGQSVKGAVGCGYFFKGCTIRLKP